MNRIVVVILLLAVAAFPSTHRRYPRSREVTRAFQRSNPCPSTGKRYGACPGYTRDHVIALCAGGSDTVSNLQWQAVTDAKAKDRTECAGSRTRKH
jgi:hypothetical protein